MLRTILIGTAVMGPVTFAARPAFACSCIADPRTVSQMVEDVDMVFEGTVREYGLSSRSPNQAVARFEVTRRWKGEVFASQIVRVESGNSCAVTYYKGHTYVLFSRVTDGAVVGDGVCRSGAERPPTAELLAALGPGMPPLPGQSTAERLVGPDEPVVAGGCQVTEGAGTAPGVARGLAALVVAGFSALVGLRLTKRA